MARSLYPSLTTAVTRIFYLHRDLPELTGDYDLSYIELPKRRRGKEYIIRIAAVHLHEASRSRTITISEELLGQMMELAYFYDWEEKLYLSPLEMLFPQPPAFMVTKELGLIQVTRLKEPDQCV